MTGFAYSLDILCDKKVKSEGFPLLLVSGVVKLNEGLPSAAILSLEVV